MAESSLKPENMYAKLKSECMSQSDEHENYFGSFGSTTMCPWLHANLVSV